MSPFLKTILEEICPCSSVSLILPDVPPDSLSSFTDWLLAGCIGEISSEWNEIFALLGVKISQEPVGRGREELLLRQFKHLELRSPRNSSDTDMFLTDDESLSVSVCKAAQCDLSAEEEEEKPGKPLKALYLTDNESKAAQCNLSAENDKLGESSGALLTMESNETVYEDCREEPEESQGNISTKLNREGGLDGSDDQNTEQEDTVDSLASEDLSEDCGHNSQDNFHDKSAIVDEQSDTGETGEDDNGGEHNSKDVKQLESKTAEQEGGESEDDSENSTEEEEDFEEEEEEETESSEGSDESAADPSWNAGEPSDSSDEEAEQERRQVRGSAVKVPRDLSLLDSSTLSLCLSDSGPIKLAVRCGCRGSCLRNCNCRAAGEECSRWCSCHASKCRSKIQQKNPEGEFCFL